MYGLASMNLLDDEALERSSAAANRNMNRDRLLTGSNGYFNELGFNPLNILRATFASEREAAWLDLCCGSGKALVEAAELVQNDNVEIVGVDLVASWPVRNDLPRLTLVEGSLSTWEPSRQFDLITSVHGLHYIGDKLGLIAQAASWLTDTGRFVANLDLSNLQVRNCSKSIAKLLHEAGLNYDNRKKLVTCAGRKQVSFPVHYLGADDQVGPNYTGQEAVTAWYDRRSKPRVDATRQH